MSGLVSSLFGGNKAQNEELDLQNQQAQQQNAVAAGQERLLQGGGTGLLAFTQNQNTAAASGMGALLGLNKLLSGAA